MSSSKELQDQPILEAKSGELDPPQCQELKPFRISRQERLVLLGSLLALLIGGTVLGLLYANARTNELFVKVPAKRIVRAGFNMSGGRAVCSLWTKIYHCSKKRLNVIPLLQWKRVNF